MKQEKSRDFIQNVIITLLFVLAVILFAKTQLYSFTQVYKLDDTLTRFQQTAVRRSKWRLCLRLCGL